MSIVMANRLKLQLESLHKQLMLSRREVRQQEEDSLL
jgi:hypothetical protein